MILVRPQPSPSLLVSQFTHGESPFRKMSITLTTPIFAVAFATILSLIISICHSPHRELIITIAPIISIATAPPALNPRVVSHRQQEEDEEEEGQAGTALEPYRKTELPDRLLGLIRTRPKRGAIPSRPWRSAE